MDYVKWSARTVRVGFQVSESLGDSLSSVAGALEKAKAIFRTLDKGVEHFAILTLDIKRRITGYKVVSTGTLDSSNIHPREVFFYAVTLKASAVILVHNHPSGMAEPSDLDISLTARLCAAGEIMGIPVLDHLILGDDTDTFYSFRDTGRIG